MKSITVSTLCDNLLQQWRRLDNFTGQKNKISMRSTGVALVRSTRNSADYFTVITVKLRLRLQAVRGGGTYSKPRRRVYIYFTGKHENVFRAAPPKRLRCPFSPVTHGPAPRPETLSVSMPSRSAVAPFSKSCFLSAVLSSDCCVRTALGARPLYSNEISGSICEGIPREGAVAGGGGVT